VTITVRLKPDTTGDDDTGAHIGGVRPSPERRR